MRVLPLAAIVGLSLLGTASSGSGQKPDDQIAPRSVALQRQGEAALAANSLSAAQDALETALIADPRNRGALLALGRVAQAQGLPGKAIHTYKDALQLDPNDVAVLGAEGEALVQRGAVDRAKANLVRVQALCKNAQCAPATMLAAAIAKGPPPPVRTAQASDKVPPKGQEQSTAGKN